MYQDFYENENNLNVPYPKPPATSDLTLARSWFVRKSINENNFNVPYPKPSATSDLTLARSWFVRKSINPFISSAKQSSFE